MVNMTHDSDDRSAGDKVFFVVNLFCLCDGFLHIGADEVNLEAELLGHHSQGFGIKTLVDGDGHTEAHAGADDLNDGHVHHCGQFVGGHKFGHLQHLLVLLLTHHLFHHGAGHCLTLLTTVL